MKKEKRLVTVRKFAEVEWDAYFESAKCYDEFGNEVRLKYTWPQGVQLLGPDDGV